jgi:hypothetical protein
MKNGGDKFSVINDQCQIHTRYGNGHQIYEVKCSFQDLKMSLKKDVTGLSLTCSSQEAVESFNKGVTAFVTMREDAVPWFKAAVEKDEAFVLGHSVMVGWQDLCPWYSLGCSHNGCTLTLFLAKISWFHLGTL